MHPDQESRTLRRAFTLGTMVVVLWVIWLILRPLLVPIAWAAMLGFLMLPLQRSLSRRLGNRTTAAAGLLTALTPVALFVPLTLIGIAFAQQVTGLAELLQNKPDLLDLTIWLDASRHPRIAAAYAWVNDQLPIDLNGVRAWFTSNLQQWAGQLAGLSGKLFLNAAGLLLNFCLMLFILFFSLRDGSGWFERLSGLLPLEAPRRDELFERLGKVTRAVVFGSGVTALVQGLMVGVGFAIAGITGPVVFGVLAAVSAVLPFGGAALIWVPAVLFLFGTGQFGWGVFLLAWGVAVSLSDNFIRPIIISRYTPVPTLLVFLGVIGGVAAFGLIGFIVGPVILVLATELLRFAEGSWTRRD